jgi:hypothetical protein
MTKRISGLSAAHKIVTPVLLASIFSVAACGQGGSTGAAATDPAKLAATSSVPNPGTVTLPPVPPIQDPKTTLGTNPNDPTTPMGTLCWATWEVGRRLAAVEVSIQLPDATVDSSAVPDAPKDPKIHKVTIDDIVSHLAAEGARAKVADGLPADVQPFSAALFGALDQAVAETAAGPISLARAKELIDFEQFPGARAYANAARTEPGCVKPG